MSGATRGKRVEIIVPENELAQKLRDACLIMSKIRRYQRIWYDHYGVENKKNLVFWEGKADEFLKALDVKEIE